MAYIKNNWTRRQFLKHLGRAGAASIPLLNAPWAVGQATGTAPKRLVVLWLAHGWGRVPGPSGYGANFTLPSHFQPLESIREHCLFIDGVRANTRMGNAHATGTPDSLTASVPYVANDEHYAQPMGPSIDTVLSSHLGGGHLRFLISPEFRGPVSSRICFDSQGRAMSQFPNPVEVFNHLAGLLPDSTSSGESDSPTASNKDVMRARLMDYALSDLNKFAQTLRGSEKHKAEKYAAGLAAIGDKYAALVSGGSSGTPVSAVGKDDLPSKPRQDSGDQYIENTYDLIRLALQADTHRVITMHMGGHLTDDWDWTDDNGVNRKGMSYIRSLLGPNDMSNFHQIVPHFGGKDHSLNAYKGYVKWHYEKVVKFVNSLASTPDVDGSSVLDNTVILLASEISHGDHARAQFVKTLIGGKNLGLRHNHLIKLPVAKDGDIRWLVQDKSGKTVDTTKKRWTYGEHTVADVYVALARAFGMNIDSFGLPILNGHTIEIKG